MTLRRPGGSSPSTPTSWRPSSSSRCSPASCRTLPSSTATAGLAALDGLMEPGTHERLRTMGNRLRDGLVEVGRRVGLPLQAPGEASVFQPIISEHEATDARSLAKQDARASYDFGVELVR